MNPRLYDSAAMARVAIEARQFREQREPAMASLRLAHLQIIEAAAQRLIRRFVGPGCPQDAADALTCVNLMGAEASCIVHQDGSTEFVIMRGIQRVDRETVPPAYSLPKKANA